MSVSKKNTVDLNIFISMPYDSDEEPNKYWGLFYKKCIEPTKKILEAETTFKVSFVHKKKDKDLGEIPQLVSNSLDSADALLCVLTELRPNVMFEVGYARSRKIPIVFVLEQEYQKQSLPILIGSPSTYYYDGTDTDSFDTVPSELWEYLKSACYEAQVKRSEILSKSSSPIYRVQCYQDRDCIDIPNVIQTTDSEIEILTTNTDYFVSQIGEAIHHPFRIKDLKDAIQRGINIRIWTMDPDSNIVLERAKLLEPVIIQKPDVFQYRKALIKNIKTLYVHFKAEMAAGHFSIGIYDALPTLMIYRFDNRYFIPSVSLIKKSRHCLHIEVDANEPGVKNTFETTLDEIRRISRPVQHYSWIEEDWPEPHKIPEDPVDNVDNVPNITTKHGI